MEVQDDLPLGPSLADFNPGFPPFFQSAFGGPQVGIFGCRLGLGRVLKPLDAPFDLPHREPLLDDLLGQGGLLVSRQGN